MEWFYVADQKQVGPFNDAEFARLVGDGTIRRETLVWRAGMKDWQPYGSLLPPTPPTPPPASSPVGGPIPGSPVAGAPGTGASAPSATMSPVRPVTTVRYAGFWIRFLARVIDYLVLKLVGWIVLTPLGLASAGFLWNGMHDLSDVLSFVAMSASCH